MNYVLRLHFRGSNNVVEYEALLHGLQIAASMGIRRLIYCGDSDLVVQQVMKTFDTKDPKMEAYCAIIQALEVKFDGLKLHHVKRSDNIVADNLARVGSSREPVPDETFLEILHKPSIKMQALGKDTKDLAPQKARPRKVPHHPQTHQRWPQW